MKTLYISDLDGTLVGSDQRISEFSCRVINGLVEKGLLFSYATARSLSTAKKVSEGLNARIPLILNNGAFIIDNATGEMLLSNFFDEKVFDLIDRLIAAEVFPIVYARIEGNDRFSFIQSRCTRGMLAFLDMRKGDERVRTVNEPSELKKGEIFNLLCIDEPEKLEPLYEEYKTVHHCVYQKDIYTHDQWLEINPRTATKANAAKLLKKMLGCDRMIAFGDGKNDIDLFEAADECYAVSNVNEELKSIASAIIPSNDEDAVARWLMEHAR